MRRNGDTDLLAGFQPWRPETFEPVVLAYQDRLLGFACRLLGNLADAEEVVQDTFVRAFRHLRRRPRDSWNDIELTPWLYRITLNLCRDIGKARSSNRGVGPLEADVPSQNDDIQASTLRMEVEAAIRQLPHGYGLVVLMRYVDQLTLDEMAQALKLPLGTVKARVHRGTRLLRQILASYLEEGE